MAQATCAQDPKRPHYNYQRRQPEKSALYQIVAKHKNTLFAQAEERSEYGAGYPTHVKEEFEAFLRCGLLQYGFARMQCACCKRERLVAFSCKCRTLCPSCSARRMADSAAHLCDHVLPVVPYRQWTFSLPRWIRLRLVQNETLLSRAFAAFIRTVFSWQRRQAKRQGIAAPLCAAIALKQRFGSLLQLNPHTHNWLPDGVFYCDDSNALQFHRLTPPTNADMDAILVKVRAKVMRLIEAAESDEPDDDQATLAADQQLAIGQPPKVSLLTDDLPRDPLTAFDRGFSIHADLSIHKNHREDLERTIRYGMRPAFSQRRLSVTPDGKVRLKLRKRYHTGQTHITFEPLEFLRRLAAIIPPRRQNQISFFGLFASRHKCRPLLKPLLPKPPPQPEPPADDDSAVTDLPADEDNGASPRYRRPYAELLARVFGDEVACCTHCQGKMRLVALIKDRDVIVKILDHLGLPSDPPPIADARPPPQMTFDDLVDADDNVVPF